MNVGMSSRWPRQFLFEHGIKIARLETFSESTMNRIAGWGQGLLKFLDEYRPSHWFHSNGNHDSAAHYTGKSVYDSLYGNCNTTVKVVSLETEHTEKQLRDIFYAERLRSACFPNYLLDNSQYDKKTIPSLLNKTDIRDILNKWRRDCNKKIKDNPTIDDLIEGLQRSRAINVKSPIFERIIEDISHRYIAKNEDGSYCYKPSQVIDYFNETYGVDIPRNAFYKLLPQEFRRAKVKKA